MRMKFKTLLLAAAAMLSLSAMANTAATDSLTINDFELYPGDTVTVSVNFKNATGYAGLQADIFFDGKGNGIIKPIKHYDSVMGTDVWFSHGSRLTYAYSLGGNNPDDTDTVKMVRFVIYNMLNTKIQPGSGEILKFTVTASKDVVPGVYDGWIGGWIKYSTGDIDQSNDGNGPSTSFKITVKDNPDTQVSDVTAAKAVQNVRYYNLSGQQSAKPFEGINVVETTYTDGSKAVTKVVK